MSGVLLEPNHRGELFHPALGRSRQGRSHSESPRGAGDGMDRIARSGIRMGQKAHHERSSHAPATVSTCRLKQFRRRHYRLAPGSDDAIGAATALRRAQTSTREWPRGRVIGRELCVRRAHGAVRTRPARTWRDQYRRRRHQGLLLRQLSPALRPPGCRRCVRLSARFCEHGRCDYGHQPG